MTSPVSREIKLTTRKTLLQKLQHLLHKLPVALLLLFDVLCCVRPVPFWKEFNNTRS